MENESRQPHEHAEQAGAPGASAPGEQGYGGGNTVGDVGGTANALEFGDQFGRPDTMDEAGPNGSLRGEGVQTGVADQDTPGGSDF